MPYHMEQWQEHLKKYEKLQAQYNLTVNNGLDFVMHSQIICSCHWKKSP
jgi:hypothetical protein